MNVAHQLSALAQETLTAAAVSAEAALPVDRQDTARFFIGRLRAGYANGATDPPIRIANTVRHITVSLSALENWLLSDHLPAHLGLSLHAPEPGQTDSVATMAFGPPIGGRVDIYE